jgi:hypothetical protein
MIHAYHVRESCQYLCVFIAPLDSTFAALNGTDLADYHNDDALDFSTTATAHSHATKAVQDNEHEDWKGSAESGPAFVSMACCLRNFCRDWIQLFEDELDLEVKAGKNHHGQYSWSSRSKR